jgi:hypothetical protein
MAPACTLLFLALASWIGIYALFLLVRPPSRLAL